MKLYLEDDSGNQKEIKEVNGIGEGDIIIRLSFAVRESDIRRMEESLSKKFDRKVIVLDCSVAEILTVPPKN